MTEVNELRHSQYFEMVTFFFKFRSSIQFQILGKVDHAYMNTTRTLKACSPEAFHCSRIYTELFHAETAQTALQPDCGTPWQTHIQVTTDYYLKIIFQNKDLNCILLFLYFSIIFLPIFCALSTPPGGRLNENFCLRQCLFCFLCSSSF